MSLRKLPNESWPDFSLPPDTSQLPHGNGENQVENKLGLTEGCSLGDIHQAPDEVLKFAFENIDLALSDDQANALAQLVKRLGWSTLREHAADDYEAQLMKDSVYLLERSLETKGYSPR